MPVIIFITAFACILIGGILIGFTTALDRVEENTIKDFHCQPIQKVETLEEAKARIEQYQERVK